MNVYEFNRLCVYLRNLPEFPFDTVDLEEDFDEVLQQCGVDLALSETERIELFGVLYPRALGFEIGELLRQAQKKEDYVLGTFVPVPSEQELKLKRLCRMKRVSPDRVPSQPIEVIA